jgi:hypothetical protein
MYRQVFVPTENNNNISFNVPREWYGREIEFVVFPIETPFIQSNIKPRLHWDEAAKQAHEAGDDQLQAPSVMADENTDWWTWEA